MTDLQLFLGIPLDRELSLHLKSLQNYDRFTSPDSDYLTEVNGPTGSFLGRKINQSIEQEHLYNVEASVYSLLAKLDPKYPFKTIPLVLFPHE